MKKLHALLFFMLCVAVYSCKEKDDSGAVPICSITSPTDGDRFLVGQIVTVIVDASDSDNDLAEVRFFLDNTHLSIDKEAPFRFSWETAGLDSGKYVIKAVAYDREFNKTADEIYLQLYKNLVVTQKEFVNVAGGTFEMGCFGSPNVCFDNELPVHTVFVDGFSITKHEITNYYYAEFLNAIQASPDGILNDVEYIDMGASQAQIYYSDGVFLPKAGFENFPVVEVSWHGAQAYCEYNGGRLPTEAEWEYAAHGGLLADSTIYSGSNDVNEVAWYIENSAQATHQVSTKFPNELGLHDMSGNVWEWCSDWYSDSYYAVSENQNPQGPADGIYKVLRGGIFNGAPQYCRISCRAKAYPLITNNASGFRMVKPLN